MADMKEIKSYAELENVSLGEQIALTVSVSEIIERPLYFRIMTVIDVIGYNVNYIAIDIRKNGTLSDVDWIKFRSLAPLDGIQVIARKTKHHYPRFDLVSFIDINKQETPHFVQYCDKCDEFEFVEDSSKFVQCHADEPRDSSRQISKVPMKLRTNSCMYHGKDPILYPIRPRGLSEVFLPHQMSIYYNSYKKFCPECAKVHDIYILRSNMTDNRYRYCPITNKPYSIIDQKLWEEIKMIDKSDLIKAESSKKEKPMDFTSHSQIPVNGMFGSKNEDGSANDYAVCPKHALETAQKAIDIAKKYNDSVGSLSDGYHTFNELYHHRAMLFAALCLTTFKNCAWKSLLHNDPKEPMYNGMFIVGIDTSFGQASYHYDIDPYWAIFKVKELDRAPKFDGHTPAEAIDRIFKYAKKIGTEPVTRSINISDPGFYNIEPQLQYVNEVDTTGTPIMRTGINISTTKKDDHNSTTLK